MKFRIVGLFLLFSFLMVGQSNLNAQSCQKVCASKSAIKAQNQTNVLAVSLESESLEKNCSKPCTKLAEVNDKEAKAVLASHSELTPAEAKKCIKTCNKSSEASANATKAVFASYTDEPTAKSGSCDPSNCEPSNCDPRNCDPSQCAIVDKLGSFNFSFLTHIFKANPDCKPAVKTQAQTVSLK